MMNSETIPNFLLWEKPKEKKEEEKENEEEGAEREEHVAWWETSKQKIRAKIVREKKSEREKHERKNLTCQSRSWFCCTFRSGGDQSIHHTIVGLQGLNRLDITVTRLFHFLFGTDASNAKVCKL